MFEALFPIPKHSLDYNKQLDSLRGVAVLLVLLFHIYPKQFSFGYVGVDIFFVLSGYLITGIIISKIESGTFSFLEFYRNRIRRIFPAMLIVLSAALVAGYFILFPQEYISLASHIKSSTLFYQNFRLMSEAGYWDEASTLKPLLHFWSLSIEEQFYLFWPLFLVVFSKINRNWFIKLFILFLILFLFSLFKFQDPFYGSLSRFWELGFGGLVYAFSRNNNFTFGKFFSIIAILIFILAISLAYGNVEYSLFKTFSIVFATGLLILSFNGYKNIIFDSNILLFFGLISYPLYLWHYLIVGYLHILGFDVSSIGILVAIASVVLSYLTYRFIETKARANDSYIFAFALIVYAAVLVAISVYIYTHDGLKSRIYIEKNQIIHEGQFVKPPFKNNNGEILVKNITGSTPKISYVKATSIDKNKKFILIVGDSHAYSSYDGLSALLKQKGYEALLLANSSCPPYKNTVLARSQNEADNCARNINEIYNTMDKMPNIKQVIFVTRGPKYITKQGFGEVDNERGIDKLEFYNNDKIISREDLFYEGIKDTFEYFRHKNITVYYVLENPELGFSPKECLKRQFGLDGRQCEVEINSFDKRMNDYRKKVQDIAAKYPNVVLLDTKDIFCDSKFCYAIKNDKMLYADDDHLSIDGSFYQAKYFIDIIIPSKVNNAK